MSVTTGTLTHHYTDGSKVVWHYPPGIIISRRHPRDARGYAGHLRGRVFRSSRFGWRFEVVNTVTGKVVASDDGCGDLAYAFACAEFATQTARATWMRGIRRKDLSRSGGSEWTRWGA